MRCLFDRLQWLDPIDGAPLEAIVFARNPSGVPLAGVLRRPGTNVGYPIVDSVVRLTPDLAHRYRDWLEAVGLSPPPLEPSDDFQAEATVDSFGFQWTWNSQMRSDDDLRWRVASRFNESPDAFADRTVLDAGAGAGDQSRWLLGHGASVVSVDLSAAINVVCQKLRCNAQWVGVQADITRLPFAADQFDCVYCEGVVQHTRDSARSVAELVRVTRVGGSILATHYGKSEHGLGRIKSGLMGWLRNRLSRWDRYKLLLLTGLIAALSYIPLLGWCLRKAGLAIYYSTMPDFKTTWTNTFDNYGNHSYQRYISPAVFWGYFAATNCCALLFREQTILKVRKEQRNLQSSRSAA